MKTNLTNPLYSINNNNSKDIKSLEEILIKEIHEVGSITYPAIAYDSYWIASKSLYKNSTNKYDNNSITKSFKQIVFDTANTMDGLSGKIHFNNAGDRINGNYDFWMINKNNKGYEWYKENYSK